MEFLKDGEESNKNCSSVAYQTLVRQSNHCRYLSLSRDATISPHTRFVLLKTASRFTRGNRRRTNPASSGPIELANAFPPPSVPRLLISSSKHLLNWTHRGWRINLWLNEWDLTSSLVKFSSFVLTPKPKRTLGVMSGVCGKLDLRVENWGNFWASIVQ